MSVNTFGPRLAALAGRQVLTIWSWVLSLPIALTVMNGFTDTPTLATEAAGTSLVCLVHLFLGLLGLLLRPLIALPRSPAGRATAALLGFALLGVCRALLIIWAGHLLAVEPPAQDLAARMLINVGTSVVVLAAIALLVDSVRQHREIDARLRTAQANIETQLGFDEERLRAVRSTYAAQLERSIDAALAAQPVTALNAAEASSLLRSISEDVVRPMSHNIFHDESPWGGEGSPAAGATEAPRVRELLRVLRPAPPALPVLLFGTLSAVHLYALYGVAFMLVQLLLGGAILCAGNLAAVLLVRRIGTAAGRITVMLACYPGAAAVSTTVMCLQQRAFGYPEHFYWSAVWFYPLTALMVALLRAAGARRRASEATLARSLSEQLMVADRVHQKLLNVRRQIAQFLHSQVQGELVSAALVLGGYGQDGNTKAEPAQVSAVLATTLARAQQEMLTEPAQATGPAETRIGGLLETWGKVVDLTQEIDPCVWRLCQEAPARADAVIEVLSEGFTNAIRHGRATQIQARIWGTEPDALHIQVSSPGRLGRPGKRGLGLAALERLSREVSLTEDGGRVTLTVVVA